MQPLVIYWALFLGASFEGEVIYVNTYIVHDQNLSIDSLRRHRGDSVILLMKAGNYKLVTTGKKRVTSIYDGEGNIWYVYDNRYDSVLAVSGLMHTKKSLLFDEPRDSDEKVMGFECRSVVMTWNSGRNIYYYNEGLAIDADLFTGHNIDGWNRYCEISKSVPLMIKYENKGFTVVQKAVLIKERQVEMREIQVPLGRPILQIK